MTAKTSRIIIKTFVRTALKDADESPERCTRNLVDMALHFSNRFPNENWVIYDEKRKKALYPFAAVSKETRVHSLWMRSLMTFARKSARKKFVR